jgi:hypothetical protein
MARPRVREHAALAHDAARVEVGVDVRLGRARGDLAHVHGEDGVMVPAVVMGSVILILALALMRSAAPGPRAESVRRGVHGFTIVREVRGLDAAP